eukprot:Blabericola_migrator_1__11239@NODE_6608_length_499_cov_45_071759_g4549_i0_p1_GENE_NODE_6608_length_499_cov_45_071759_g4549_i0NODE_6608_length_499_cov_45_071759_g4549_i0_p1_ORF_typecomplete_len135_score6_80DUF4764/PF15961_5/0_058zfAN1/PF01428_16/13zfAN1/PF01428_16/84_NODE_6608_length_499_cov_45_071759_g4549_i095478
MGGQEVGNDSKLFRCKACGKQLFTENEIAEVHDQSAPEHQLRKGFPKKRGVQRWANNSKCTSIHLDEATWFGMDFEAGNQEGPIYCPTVQCNKKVGRFCWHGLTCSCGQWTSPAFQIHVSKIGRSKG